MAPGLYDITPLESLIEQGYTLLTPNFRLARRIKAEWDARQLASGKGTWEPAPVLPLESWLQQQWELAVSNGLLPPVVPLTAAQSVEVWRQVISQQQSHSPEFQLLKPSGAAELAAAARDSLVRWQVDWRTAGNKALFQLEGDCCTFLQWLELFEDRLQRDGFCTEVDCLAHLPGLKGSLREARVALVEFELIPPLLRAALESLCSDVRDVSPPSDCADRLVHSFNDKRSELQAVASWAANIHRVGSGTTTAIVLSEMASDRVPLEYLLRREFDCLGHNYASLPVNFSTGITLDKAPLVRDALAALAMGLQECTIAAVEGLQRSRFLNLPDAQGALAQRFIRQLYAQGRAVVSVSDIRNEAQSVQLGDAKGL
ncbi:MAG: hypothetical protein KDI33_18870, partial [Halioglobus sp.]|nr:hypothetical protein [Halioglobus sp.]